MVEDREDGKMQNWLAVRSDNAIQLSRPRRRESSIKIANFFLDEYIGEKWMFFETFGLNASKPRLSREHY